MRLIEIKDNTFINPSQVCQIKLWNFGSEWSVGVHFAGHSSVTIKVPKGQDPGKFLWTIKEWIRTGFHPYGYDSEPEDTEEPTGIFNANMLRAER
tara:strand:- start:1299 stop:1583 length:285 start_codon:yes stop_codon:yes gene_type:complete